MAVRDPDAAWETAAAPLGARQAGVALGMFLAVLVTAGLYFWGPRPWGEGDAARPLTAALASLGPLITLTACVGALANLRFFSRADIDAAAGGPPSNAARIRQAILQNTLEQTVLALGVYGLMALVLPVGQLALPLVLSAAFVLGRIAFAAGYARGAAGRAFGFGLTFYPTVAGLAYVAWLIVRRLNAA